MKKILGIAVLVGIFLIGCATTNEVAPSDPLQFEGSWKFFSTKNWQDTFTFSGNNFIRYVEYDNDAAHVGDSGIFTFTDKKITFYSARSGRKYSAAYTLNEGSLKIGRDEFQKLNEPLVLSTSIRIEGINGMKHVGVWIFKELPFNWTNTAISYSYVQDNSLTVNLTLHQYLTDNPSWEGMESSILWQGEGDYYMIIKPAGSSGPLLIYTGDDGKPLQYSFTKHQSVVLPFAQFKIYEEL